MLINKKVTDNLGRGLDFKIEKLVPHSYYLIDVKLFISNVHHKSIMSTSGWKHGDVWVLDKMVELYNRGYEY